MRIFISKHRFLLRLIVLTLTVVCIAVLVYNVGVLRRAHHYMEEKTREKYHDSACAFANYLDEQFLWMYSYAMRMNYSQNLLIDLDAHVFNQVEFIRQMKSYLNATPLASEMCVYFAGSDYVVSSAAKYSVDYFTYNYLSEGDDALAEELRAFVCEDAQERWSFASTFGRGFLSAERLIMRVPVTILGEYGVRKANVLYLITTDSMKSMFIASLDENMEHAIFTADGVLLYQCNNLSAHFQQWSMDTPWVNVDYTVDGIDYTAFSAEKRLLYYSLIPAADITRNLTEYYQTMTRMTWVCVAALLAASALAVFGSYAPVYCKVRNIAHRHGDDIGYGELDAIEAIVIRMEQQNVQMENLVQEQSALLDDVVVEALLRGKSLSESQSAWLDRRVSASRFGVLAIAELLLNHSARKALQKTMREVHGVQTIVVGVPQEQHTVFFCVLDGGVSLKQVAQSAYAALNIPGTAIGVGPMAHSLEDAHGAYVCALIAMRQGGGLTYYEEMIHACGKIMECPTEDTLLLVRCMEDGDTQTASNVLTRLREYLRQREYPPEQASFLRHELESTLIKNMHRLRIPVPEEREQALICAANADALCSLLEDMVADACKIVREIREEETRNFNQRILEHVTKHFTDPEISLSKVSDAFGLSIYALSRLYKEAAGVGFREHIIALRLDLALRLVLTTGMSIREIADETGIANPDYLTKLFKMHYGATPSQMRQEALGRGHRLS